MDPTILRVLIGTFLIGVTAALVGTFTFLQKKALIGDALSHSILPGIILAYVYSGKREIWILFLGALIAGWFASYQIGWILKRTKLKTDAAIAVVLSTFFALGLIGLSLLQSHPKGQAGLSDFLFGKTAAISTSDIQQFAVISVAIIGVIIWKYHTFASISFNSDFMKTRGFSLNWNSFLLTTLTILAIAMGIQAVGVVLMSALLIIPVATARMFTYHLKVLMLLAVIFGVSSAILGSFISLSAVNMPTGPWIIMVLCGFMIVGAVWRWMSERKKERRSHG